MPGEYAAQVFQNGTNIWATDAIGNIIDFGTFGTNDVRVIQTALNQTGRVFIGKGIYIIDSVLRVPSNTFVIGAGIGTTILKVKSGVNTDVIYNSAFDLMYTNSNSNISIGRLEVDASLAAGNGTINFQYVLGLWLSDIWVHGCKAACITADSCSPVTLFNCRGSNTRTPNTSGEGIVVVGCKDFVLVGCMADSNNGISGIDIEAAVTTVLEGTSLNNRGLVSDCISKGNTGQGWTISNTIRTTFVNCKAVNNQQDGFQVASTCYFVGCSSEDNSTQAANTYSAYHVIGSAYNGSFAACIDQGSHKYGYLFDPGTSHWKVIYPHEYSVGTALFQDSSTGQNNKLLAWNNTSQEIAKINADSTSQAITVAETNITTYSLSANSYENILVEADVEITTTTTSTAQSITIKIKSGTTVVKTYTVQTRTQADKINLHVKGFVVQKAAATIAITESAPAGDANTTAIVKNLFVQGLYQ
ncbi:hypothetical protein [Nitrososphaera sp.]|uniref:hypothetical protein n=1 Tax=Nitrososphaera sp. TaxID=1971748 RepID=UPI00307F4F18